MKYKAHIIKLDRSIVFQPIYVDTEIYDKISRLRDQPIFIDDFSIYYGGNPELGNDYIFLGTTSLVNRFIKGERFMYCNKDFRDNEQRDTYYNKLIKLIEKSIEQIK